MPSGASRIFRGTTSSSGPRIAISDGHEEDADDRRVDRDGQRDPDADLLDSTTPDVANAPTAMQKSSAAAVTIRPVRSRPTATASRFGRPPSQPSLIRVSRNTP